MIINGPNVWPNSGTMIPSGSLVSLAVDCVSGFATQGVLKLDESKTPCKYDKTGVYNQETCLSHCKRTYVIKHCGCNPSFLFPLSMSSYLENVRRRLQHVTDTSLTFRYVSASERDCNAEDFICLADFNGKQLSLSDVPSRIFRAHVKIYHANLSVSSFLLQQDLFNDYVVHAEEEIPENSRAMICDCPPECDYYIYNTRFSNVPLHAMNNVMLDVHFIGQTTFRYKTDIVITQLDLLGILFCIF